MGNTIIIAKVNGGYEVSLGLGASPVWIAERARAIAMIQFALVVTYRQVME